MAGGATPGGESGAEPSRSHLPRLPPRLRLRRRLGLALVRGDSMLPSLRPGDRLLVRYGAVPRPGAVVIARFRDGTVVVKRCIERRGGGWWLLGDAAPVGVDSRHRGPVPDRDVLGVVVLRCWPRPGPVPPAPDTTT